MVTYEDIRHNESIKTYIDQADKSLLALGYTEHSFAHVTMVAKTAKDILTTLGYPEHDIELVQIAAHLHDIGNLVNRIEHSQSGAILAFQILNALNMPPEDIALICTAIGNHDEGTGVPVNHIAAALILGDKTDVRRSRVRNQDITSFDIHDRVNYSVQSADTKIDTKTNTFTLSLLIDDHYGSIMDYFEIFLNRMILCRKAALMLGLTFQLIINEQQVI